MLFKVLFCVCVNGNHVIKIVDCVDTSLSFLPATSNGFRKIMNGDTVFVYDAKQNAYVEGH